MSWGERLLVYVGWIVPPLVGAVLNLRWWITMLLLVPATSWYVMALKRGFVTKRGEGWDRVPLAYSLPGVLAIALVVPGLSGLQRYAGCLATVLLVLADLIRGGGTDSPRR
jgi:hypothetical protein